MGGGTLDTSQHNRTWGNPGHFLAEQDMGAGPRTPLSKAGPGGGGTPDSSQQSRAAGWISSQRTGWLVMSLWFSQYTLRGTMFHACWTCPKVQRFWIRNFNLLLSVTQINIPKKAESALFSKLPDSVPKFHCILAFKS
uniref:Uncharacterized protein n=1 Tax=Pyxicephalus adspersus TaxID=30357 RepID=A0AAV3AUB9_PYXAD|nr:TPA: hypothetical protein GDO54_010008 [Pyxicephalus adspersus]